MIKSKRRIVSMLTVLALVLTMMPAVAAADTDAGTAEVYVTVTDHEGELVMIQEKITVTDADVDGELTINDALYNAHEATYEGGAAAGYGSALTSWGLSITKLWGDTSGAFGYCVNDVPANGLTDPVRDGDYVNAYIYTDQIGWSDSYSYFDKKNITAKAGENVDLTLLYVCYDANWNKVSYPVKGAVITVDGNDTEFVTDENGEVEITLDESTHLISAYSDTQNLVPAVCMATVIADDEDDGISDNPDDSEQLVQDGDDEQDGTEQNEDQDLDQSDESSDDQSTENTETEDNPDEEQMVEEPEVDQVDSTPQTGDDFNVVLYGIIALTALSAAGFCLKRKTCK